jgi:ribonucleotide monophosphatase NagD (HAD superfamily)
VAEKRIRSTLTRTRTRIEADDRIVRLSACLQDVLDTVAPNIAPRAEDISNALLPLLEKARSPTKHHSPELFIANRGITGYILDLDGTIYKPGGLIDGAREFVAWLLDEEIPFVFLSNRGDYGAAGVQQKLIDLGLTDEPIRLRHMHTACEAQVSYLIDNVPPGAKMFVVAGEESFWLDALRERVPALCDSWDIRTALDDDEVKSWAVFSMANPGCVYVVLFIDGELSSSTDPVTGEPGYADWSYDVIKKCTYLVGGGAQFVYTADDAFNACHDPRYPGVVFPLPRTGMIAAMIRHAAYPLGLKNLHCVGKGGNDGATYMMSHAVSMLQLQGHDGDLSSILMVGDRFDTDIAGACVIGIRSCLVESGCHHRDMQMHYPQARATFFAFSVYDMVPMSYMTLDSFEETPRSPTYRMSKPPSLNSPPSSCKSNSGLRTLAKNSVVHRGYESGLGLSFS